jgi:hypothetical protein
MELFLGLSILVYLAGVFIFLVGGASDYSLEANYHLKRKAARRFFLAPIWPLWAAKNLMDMWKVAWSHED